VEDHVKTKSPFILLCSAALSVLAVFGHRQKTDDPQSLATEQSLQSPSIDGAKPVVLVPAAKTAGTESQVGSSLVSRSGSQASQEIENTTEFRQDVDHLKRLGQAAGTDPLGEATIQTLFQTIVSKQGGAVKDSPIDCRKQSRCPMKLQEFYQESLNRLPEQEFPEMKALIQENLVESEMSIQEKLAILNQELQADSIQSIPETEINPQTEQMIMNQQYRYLLSTQENLLKIGTSFEEMKSASYQAIQKANDPIAKLMLSVNLIRKFPKQYMTLATELEQAGVSQNDLADAVFGRLPATTE
jgi:hypothetical protein